MILSVLNRREARRVSLRYRLNYEIVPLRISKELFVINRRIAHQKGMETVKGLMLKQPHFKIGDKSRYDKLYQKYLLRSNTKGEERKR